MLWYKPVLKWAQHVHLYALKEHNVKTNIYGKDFDSCPKTYMCNKSATIFNEWVKYFLQN